MKDWDRNSCRLDGLFRNQGLRLERLRIHVPDEHWRRLRLTQVDCSTACGSAGVLGFLVFIVDLLDCHLYLHALLLDLLHLLLLAQLELALDLSELSAVSYPAI